MEPQASTATPSQTTAPAPKSASGWSGFAILLVLGVCFFLCAGGLVVFFRNLARMAQAQMEAAECSTQMQRIVLALDAYHGDFSVYPPAIVKDAQGRPAHTWRVLLLPYLDKPEQDLHAEYRFDEAWDGPNNRRLAERMPLVYGCPCDPGQLDSQTSYLAVIDPATGLISAPPANTTNRPPVKGKPAAPLLLVEVCESGINWLEPKDIAYIPGGPAPLGQRTRFSYHPRGGSNVILDDATPQMLSGEELKPLLTRSPPPAAKK
ncbi:MAG: DUF1559 domain-containing protein [Pirellulales bacterium]